MQPFKNSPFAYGAGVARSEVQVDQGLRAFMLGVYNNMTIGLAISALVALGVNKLAIAASAAEAYRNAAGAPVRMGGQYLTQFGYTLYGTPLMWVVALAPLAFIFFFSFRMDRMTAASARTAFFAFSAVMGLSLASVFLVFTGTNIARTFFITAAMFGATSLYGYTTKRDLSKFGSFLVMGLIGIIIASLVNIFLGSSALQFAISIIGVLVFTGLTAYDTQTIKEQYAEGFGHEANNKMAVVGALSLYLNFINLFQLLLSLTGQREE